MNSTTEPITIWVPDEPRKPIDLRYWGWLYSRSTNVPVPMAWMLIQGTGRPSEMALLTAHRYFVI